MRVWTRCALAAALALGGAGAAFAQAPTAEEARRFVDEAEARLMVLVEEAGRAEWVKSNFITEDTEILAAKANQRSLAAAVEYAKGAARFNSVTVAPDVRRRLDLLRVAINPPVPADPRLSEELTRIIAGMEGDYGKGKWCRAAAAAAGGTTGKVLGGPGGVEQPPVPSGAATSGGGAAEDCLDINALSRILAESRNEKELREVWTGWHAIGPRMRDDYTRYVTLSNQGARELGYPDTGAMWRSKYDMPPDAFAREVDRLWGQVRPLYVSLHAYVRRKLRETYGPSVVPEKGPIPAHLLGNMWAQQWANVYPMVAPKTAAAAVDLNPILARRKPDAREMVRIGERFFTSLGFAPLPATFWERSLFVKPRDREVVCHASAWDVDNVDDLRIKMCIEPNAEDFVTIHHELGHNFYQRAYNKQPFLYRDSANDGFHEAIGDAVALSITPAYLKQIGYIDAEPDPSADIGQLLNLAMDKVAFLPFGLLIDQWRWKVFDGSVTPATYNAAWWELRARYQGVAPPVARSEKDFDPGAKYHVPANVSYTRYFLAHILQFQFHRALCEAAGQKGPLNRCSIYGSKEAGAKLQAMLAMGQSRPWPDALEALTGKREIDATAILDYFAPLQKWLDEQNAGQPTGW
jgi:peptidyl-dipeptidase A